MLKVIFRKYKDGDVIALFPTILWSGYSIASYMHIGQHGAAHYDTVIRNTKPAKENDYAELLSELKEIGYTDLRVMQKCRPNYRQLLS